MGVSSRRYDSMDPQKQLRPEQHYSVHSHIGTRIEIFGYLEHVPIQVDIHARVYRTNNECIKDNHDQPRNLPQTHGNWHHYSATTTANRSKIPNRMKNYVARLAESRLDRMGSDTAVM